MWIVVGLGNPGPEYRGTRHNVGFRVIEELRGRHGAAPERREARSLVSRIRIGEAEMIVARPQTYMNRSGTAAVELMKRYEAAAGECLVVCDDLYLEVGSLRLRARGSHGGHNGLRSLIETMGTGDFPRLRIGVGPADPDVDHAEFVLGGFRRDERSRMDEMILRAADCVEEVARQGLGGAMNRYNRRSDEGTTDADAAS